MEQLVVLCIPNRHFWLSCRWLPLQQAADSGSHLQLSQKCLLGMQRSTSCSIFTVKLVPACQVA